MNDMACVPNFTTTLETPKNDDPPLPYESKWKYVGQKKTSNGLYPLMMLTSPRIQGSHKIAAFDLDRTLIMAKSDINLMFGKGPTDWKWIDNVKGKLTSLYKEGFKVVVFTNQREMGRGNVNPKDFKQKIGAIVNEAGFPIQVYISTGENKYRKPSTQMWDHLVENENDKICPDMKVSFYVGDAAGRYANWAPGKPEDFSCSDRMLAANIGIPFYTPEEFFSGEKQAPFSWRSYDPKQILVDTGSSLEYSYHNENMDMIMMVGPPASGKSTFCSRHLLPFGYIRIGVNRNTTASDICAIQTVLSEGKNVVADGRNASKAERAEYIIVAKDAGYNVRCFTMTTPLNLAYHLNYFRHLLTSVSRIPGAEYDIYKETCQKPEKEEGFEEIIHIPFVPFFDKESDKKLFLKWTAD